VSAKNRGTKPIANDAYPTPPWAVRRLLEAVERESLMYNWWLEPASGSGAIITEINSMAFRPRKWTAVDVVLGDHPNYVCDFLSWEPSAYYDVAITNPPFSLAFEFAKKMTSIARHSFLLTRLNILEAGKKSGRLTWLSQNTPDVYVLPDRPCFSHTLRCSDRKSDGRTYDCKGVPIAWDAPAPASIECGCRQVHRELAPGTWPVELRTAGTDASGYCWLHWDSSKLPRTSGLITHLAETPKSERVDRVVAR
jgi:hypothetical protein